MRRNYLWHADFKHQYINACKVSLIFIQDDYSCFIVNFAVAAGKKVDVVMVALDEAVRLYGKPEVLMSDGGSAFYSWPGVSQLTRLLEDYGIDQHIAKTPTVTSQYGAQLWATHAALLKATGKDEVELQSILDSVKAKLDAASAVEWNVQRQINELQSGQYASGLKLEASEKLVAQRTAAAKALATDAVFLVAELKVIKQDTADLANTITKLKADLVPFQVTVEGPEGQRNKRWIPRFQQAMDGN